MVVQFFSMRVSFSSPVCKDDMAFDLLINSHSTERELFKHIPASSRSSQPTRPETALIMELAHEVNKIKHKIGGFLLFKMQNTKKILPLFIFKKRYH
jgi:hypothetical protein